jgi:parallel beta-helix repeat protein
MPMPPAAFLSYVRDEDEHEEGRITDLRKRLEGEIRLYTGRKEFTIFQDRELAWGEQWQARIEQVLDGSTFFIPILTPRFFASGPCRKELERFLRREKQLGRQDLILPIYYVDTSAFNDPARRATDDLAAAIAARQYVDWRELRHEPRTDPRVGKTLAQMAQKVLAALEQSGGHPGASAAAVQPVQAPPASAGSPPPIPDLAPAAAGSPSAKPEPPTHVVDPWHRGDFTSISEAIAAAKPGDRILVRPGLYVEALLLDKPVEIVGDGPLEEIVVQAANNHVIRFRATVGRITNLTLQQTGGNQWCAVDIPQGRLEVVGCDITSLGFACVAIYQGADPRLRRNRIHDGKAAGVLIHSRARGTLEDNEILANEGPGVEIRSDSNPLLRRNRIHDGRGSGVHCEGGKGILEENEIFANGLAGVDIGAVSHPTLIRNRIHHGRAEGIAVHDGGEGVIEGNEILANGRAGVEIASGGNPTLRGNRIYDGRSSGVLVRDEGGGRLEDNDIVGNTLAGVVIQEKSNPSLIGNRIHDGRDEGVLVRSNGEGVLVDNEIFGNAGPGISIASGSDPKCVRNRIHDGKDAGVMVSDHGRGALNDNTISANEGAGVEIWGFGNPTLTDNRISNGRGAGVWVHAEGTGVVARNEIAGHALAGIEIESGGKPTLLHNRITGNMIGIRITNDGGGTVEGNDLRGNRQRSWYVEPGSPVQLTDNLDT